MIAIAKAVRPLKTKLQRKRTTYHNTTGAGLNNVCKNLDSDSIYHVP